MTRFSQLTVSSQVGTRRLVVALGEEESLCATRA